MTENIYEESKTTRLILFRQLHLQDFNASPPATHKIIVPYTRNRWASPIFGYNSNISIKSLITFHSSLQHSVFGSAYRPVLTDSPYPSVDFLKGS